MTSSTPSPRAATVLTIGGAPPLASACAAAEGLHVPQVAGHLVGAVPVGLVDDEDVGDLEDAGLRRLDRRRRSPARARAAVVSASEAISTSACPTPTVSTRTTSQPAASSTRSACGTAADSPPSWPREAIDRMKTPSSVAWSCIRTRSPSSAPPENGEDGSTASTPTRRPAARNAVTSAVVEVDLPTPGEPVSPTTCAWPPCGCERRRDLAQGCGESFSTSEISRATARGSRRAPARPAPRRRRRGASRPLRQGRAGSARRPGRRRRTAPPRPCRRRGA